MAMAGIGILFMFLCMGCAETKLIPLTPGWEAYLAPAVRFSNGQFLPLQTSNKTIISSSNSTFALGLFSPDFSTTATMIICLLPFNSSIGIDVWNVGTSMTENDLVLRVPKNRSELQLLDAAYNVIWSVDGNVSALELTESGNFIVYNSSQGIIWQSFDHPTDTFLPGQILKQGWQMRASNSSYSASYALSVEPSGLVLYSTAGDVRLPYWVDTDEGTWDYNKAMQKCGDSGIFVTYTSTDTTDYVLLNGSACNKTDQFELVLGYPSKARFIRLDSDGNIRHYLWKQGTLSINYEVYGQKDACNLPAVCGSYGICSKGGQCNCPSEYSSSSLQGVFTSDSSTKGCKLATALTCDATGMRNQIFFNVSNVTYFSNSYVAPLNWTEKDECVSSCLSNCSCLAAFYEDSLNISARACYHVSSHMSSLQAITPDSEKSYMAYLKVQLSDHKKLNSISHTMVIIISIAATIAFLILAALVGLIICFCSKRFSKEEFDILTTVPGVPHKFSLKDLEIATSGFQCKLGEGGFGAVFGGKLQDGRTIAVKRLEGARQGFREFEAEVRTLGGIDHVNLVRLYGFCLEGVNRLLVYEWMPNGSLDKWLFVENSDRVLPWSTRIAIAMDTAQGLAYLHEGCSHPVLHLDIKPQNILLGENFKAKLSDLGMARLINQETSTVITQIRGTPGYLAPEWASQLTVSKKCDVYSYGIVLLEIISGKRVYGSCDTWYLPTWVFMKIESGNIMEVVDPRMNGDFEHDKAEKIIRLACWCIHENADQRPAMPEIMEMLQEKMEVPELTFTEPQPIKNLTRSINPGCTVISGAEYSLDMLVPR